jgi:hypothetical protein
LLAPGLFFRNEVHPRAGGEIFRRLRAAVQHDHQWNSLTMIAYVFFPQ